MNLLVLCCVVLFLFGLYPNMRPCEAGMQLSVSAYWEPGVDSWQKLPRNMPQYAALSDLKPADESKVHNPEIFKAFLPPRTDTVVGDVWVFDARQMLPFLRQFHPGATVSLSGQRGAYACLRAVSPDYYEIVFQFHSDFDLEIEETSIALEELFAELQPAKEESIAGLRKEIAELQPAEEERIAGLQKEIEEQFAELQPAKEESIAGLQKEIATLDSENDLRQLKKELAEAVASLTEMTTTLEALSGDLETRLDELKTTIIALEEVVSNLDAKLNELEQRLTAHFDVKLNAFEKRLSAHLDTRLDALETELTANLDARLDAFEAELTINFDARFDTLRKVLTAQENILTMRLNALSTEIARLKGSQAYNEGIYLTPKEFRGRLLVEGKPGQVGIIAAFSLACPAEDGNATLFVFGDTEKVSMPQMELSVGNFDKYDITWTNAITVEQAREALGLKFAARKSRVENQR